MHWTHTLVIALAIIVAGIAMSRAQVSGNVYTVATTGGGGTAWVAGDGKVWRCYTSAPTHKCDVQNLPF